MEPGQLQVPSACSVFSACPQHQQSSICPQRPQLLLPTAKQARKHPGVSTSQPIWPPQCSALVQTHQLTLQGQLTLLCLSASSLIQCGQNIFLNQTPRSHSPLKSPSLRIKSAPWSPVTAVHSLIHSFIHSFIHSLTHSFSKYLLSHYCV